MRTVDDDHVAAVQVFSGMNGHGGLSTGFQQRYEQPSRACGGRRLAIDSVADKSAAVAGAKALVMGGRDRFLVVQTMGRPPLLLHQPDRIALVGWAISLSATSASAVPTSCHAGSAQRSP